MFKHIKNGFRASASKEHLSSLQGIIKTRLGALREDRTTADQDMLVDDFDEVLFAWGIESEDDLPSVMSTLQYRLFFFVLAILVAICVALFLQNMAASLSLVFVVLPCLLGVLVTCWRMAVLRHCRFVPFWRWLWSGHALR